MVMDTAERKKLIAEGKRHAKIAAAIAEEKRILASKPVHRMTPEPRLKHLPKYADPKKPGEACAVDILKAKREKMAAGVAMMAGAPAKEASAEGKAKEAEKAAKAKADAKAKRDAKKKAKEKKK